MPQNKCVKLRALTWWSERVTPGPRLLVPTVTRLALLGATNGKGGVCDGRTLEDPTALSAQFGDNCIIREKINKEL